MTRNYLIAMGLLAVLAIASFGLMNEAIRTENTDAAEINTSGRQRMLSQRIANLSNGLIAFPGRRTQTHKALTDAIDLMENSHNNLIQGNPDVGLPGKPSAEIHTMYFGPPLRLDSQVRRFLAEARAFAQAPGAKLTLNNPHFQYIHSQTLAPLLNGLDAVVQQYQAESEAGIVNLQQAAFFSMAMTMAVLLACGLWIFRPMARRIRGEMQRLTDSETRIHTMMDNMVDGLITIDESGIVESFNPAAEAIFGYGKDEVAGKNIKMLMPEPYRSGHDVYLANYLETGEKKVIGTGREVTGRRKDDSTFPLDLAISEMFVGGKRMFVGTVRDISERKRVERTLQEQYTEMERSNAELQQFAYVASHDLQEPLRMVSSYTQLLERRYKGKLDADADEFIGFAVDGARRMQRLINDLLTYSRVQTKGKAFAPADCEAVLEEALANLRMATRESNALITHDPLPTVMADASQLVQLFQNLIGNAIKFHKPDEAPEIHVSAVPAEQSLVASCGEKSLVASRLSLAISNEQRVTFSISDNGIGIDPQYAERIFVIFQRLHGREEYAGTGIGLAVCRKIVERHGGSIRMESEQGKGSAFYFTLPECNNGK